MKKLLSILLLLAIMTTMSACIGDNSTDLESDIVSSDGYYENQDTSSIEDSNEVESTENGGNSTTGGLSSDFKSAMDNYEKFMDEYVAFMKKYKANPTDFSLLADYADYMSKYSNFIQSFEEWENKDLNSDELAYYIDVQSRVSKKLLEVTQ